MVEFLSPVSNLLAAHREVLPEQALGNQMLIHTEQTGFPDLGTCKVALVGVAESRKSIQYIGETPSFEIIRKEFYTLFPGNWHTKIADLGDINAGESVEDTYFALKTVVEELLKNNIIPVIIGGSQDLLYAVYRAFDHQKRMINIVNVDSKFDIGNAEAPIHSESYIGKMVVEKPYNLFNYCNIGYQTYFNSAEEIALLEKMYFDAYRLGEVVKNISLVEPVTRDADIVTIDITAIKASELSYIASNSPNGFDGREICAIARYAGLSNRLAAFGVFEINRPVKNDITGMFIAQVLWYFIEGVNFRMDDGNFENDKDYLTYKVPVEDEVLVFKKSKFTERWWIELPFLSSVNNKLKRHTLLPCTREDYENACNQEIPERWYKARRKNEI
jgi:formiminoglutamase